MVMVVVDAAVVMEEHSQNDVGCRLRYRYHVDAGAAG